MKTIRLLAVSAAIAVELFVACKTNNVSSTTNQALGAQCGGGAECGSNLVCVLGYCRQPCTTNSDCGSGGVCLSGGSDGDGCRLPDETNCPSTACPSGLTCAHDGTCRNACSTSVPCSIPDDVCDQGACSAGTSPMDSGGADTSLPAMDSGGGDAPSESSTCSPACGVGFQCVAGTCEACGAMNEVCCGAACGANLSCQSGKCTCGGPGEACCAGTTCNGGVSCMMGTCACGASGQACCPASDGGSSTCTGALECAGAACSCLVAVDVEYAQRSDGSLYQANTPAGVIMLNGTPVIATSFSVGSTGSAVGNYACAVSSGNVWCWIFGAGGYAAGELGDGTTNQSTTPVEVVTGPPPSSPLANIVSIAVDGGTGCAVDTSGHVWCWGAGTNYQLGTGTNTNSLWAVEVQSQSGGPPFSGAAQVATSFYGSCARKTDGSVWCWGDNSFGQSGQGTAQANYPYPVQVSALFTNVIALKEAYYQTATFCALTSDTSVWCWGGGGQYGSAPVKLTTDGDAGTPLSGVQQLAGECGLKSDGTVWCWIGKTATQLIVNSLPVYAFTVGSGQAYIDRNGIAYEAYNGTKESIPCP